MATFTTLPDASLEPGKPIRSIDGLALRDNPIAITEGAAGAPRIVGNAAKRLADYPVLSVTAADTHSALNGVTNISETTSTSSSSNVVARTTTIQLYTGSLRFSFTQTQSSTNLVQTTGIAQVFKNNSLIQSFSITTETSDSGVRTIDISIVPTDIIEIRHRVSINATFGTSSIGPVTVFGSNGYTTRNLFIPALEVNNV